MNKFNENFRDIYKKYQRFSIGIAFKVVKNEEAAKDISQDVFYHLYQLGEKLDVSNDERLKYLIAKATANKAKDYLRKAHVKREVCAVDYDNEGEKAGRSGNPEARMLHMEEVEYQKLVLARLYDKNPVNYDILMKTKYYGIPPDVVAEEYGITRNNVNNRVRRAKLWLEKEMAKLYKK